MSGKDIPLFEFAGEERTATPLPRVRRGVTFDSSLRPDEKAIRRFWSNVVRGPGSACWLWVGPISTPDGYGRFSWQVGGHRRTVSAHRFALMIATGKEIPQGLVGEHFCCEPLCVRAGSYHVRLTTQAENISWAVDRGRHAGSSPGSGSAGRALRSQLVRDAVRDGWDEDALRAARDFNVLDENQSRLW